MQRDVQAPAFHSSDSQQNRRQALYAVLAAIPPGSVTSYGELARMAGLGRAARWVGRELARLPDGSALPWHRVITASGRTRLADGTPAGIEQRARLRAEGVVVRGDHIDMRRYRWRPDEHSG